MRRRRFLLAAGALAAPLRAAAQSGAPRVGVVLHSEPYVRSIEGLRTGLKELGLREERDFALEVTDAKGDVKVIEDTARRFERENVRLIHVVSTTATTAVRRATTKVPIVFCVGTDPILSGLVGSFAKPGGRLTGVNYLTTDLTSKRLELLKDLLPKLKRVVTLYNPANPAAQASTEIAREGSARLGLQLIERHVRSAAEVDAAVAALKPGEADALFLVADALVASRSQTLIERARAIRMPTMVYEQTLAERGALVSYGVDFREIGRHSAKLVQRVLAGTRPADLPVENVTHLAFVLNRRTAQEIGVPIPPAMIVRFDRVIE